MKLMILIERNDFDLIEALNKYFIVTSDIMSLLGKIKACIN